MIEWTQADYDRLKPRMVSLAQTIAGERKLLKRDRELIRDLVLLAHLQFGSLHWFDEIEMAYRENRHNIKRPFGWLKTEFWRKTKKLGCDLNDVRAAPEAGRGGHGMTHIGIDPGKTGGIAVIRDDGPQAWKMPETRRDLWDLIVDLEDRGCFAVVEKVHTSPQMGVKSAGTFMQGKGEVLMALTAAGIPFEEIAPGRWQRSMQCLTKGDKNVTKRRAQELFPQLKVTHSIADALLIAEYCRRVRAS